MNNNTKYFLKDEAITNREEDYFRHEDIADNIVNIIETQKTPYNIALIGKWGTGKSSIVELVKRKLGNPKKYKFAEINAWKYEKEELRRTLLKQVFEAIDGKKEKELINEQLDNLTNIVIKEEVSKNTEEVNIIKKILNKLLLLSIPVIKLGIQAILVFLVITIIYFIGYFILSVIRGEEIIIGEYVSSYIKSGFVSKAIIAFLTPIVKELIDVYKVKGLNFWKIVYPKTGTDEYEELLKKYLGSFKKKVVVIVDDIDRLTTPKIVEALDAIKAFAEFQKIVFIVPFDDSVLKKALEVSEKEYQVDTQMVQSELFLDKLFQFRVYMPPLPEYDIKEYTHELCKKECTELIDICGNNFNEIVDEILIHPNVNNPRQVKKILNNFLNNYLIATKRDSIKLEQGLLISDIGIKVIAKLSVLQCDFNEFYDKLVDDFNLEKNLLNFYNDRNKEKKFPGNLNEVSEYFEGNNLKEKYLPLINYLILTSTIEVENIAPYIYMAQDKLGIEMGDKKQRKIRESLESKNIVNIHNLINEDIENVKKVIKNQIEVSKVSTNTISTIINCIHLLPNEYLREISNLLIKKLYRAYTNNRISNYLEYDIENVMLLYKTANKNNQLDDIIINIMNVVVSDKVNKDAKQKIMKCLIDNNKVMEEKLKLNFKFIIESIYSLSIENYTIEDFIEQVSIQDFDIDYYLQEKQYKELCVYIQDNEYTTSKALNFVIEISKILIKNKEYDICLQAVEKWINMDQLIETMEKIVILMSKKMSIGISNEILCNINTELLKDKMDNITNIIENLNYQITEENKVILDEKFIAIEEQMYITSIIKNICKNSQMKYLDGLSKNISKQLLTDDAYQQILNEILLSYSNAQLNNVNTLIKPLFSSATGIEENNLERVIQIARALISNNLLIEEMKKNLISSINVLKSYYNQEAWANWIIEIIGENLSLLPDSSVAEYSNLACKLLKNNLYQNFALKAIKYMDNKLSGNNLDVVIETIFEQNIDLVHNRKMIETLMSNSENNYYADYISVLVKQIDNSNYDTIHDVLDKNIDYIEEDEYISKINVLDDKKTEKASNIIEKLYIRNTENNKDGIIEELLNKCIDFNKLWIVGNKIIYDIDYLDKIQLEQIENDDGLNNLLKIIIKCNYKKEDVHKIIIYLLESVSDEEILKTIKIIEDMDKKYYPVRREKLNISNAMYSLFNRTTSIETKREICLVIKKLGMRDQFLRNEFNDIDKEILKTL